MVERNFSIVEAWGSIPHTSNFFFFCEELTVYLMLYIKSSHHTISNHHFTVADNLARHRSLPSAVFSIPSVASQLRSHEEALCV